MTTLVSTPTVGLEDLQRAAFYIFFEGMNNALSEISEYWTVRDERFNEVTGQSIPVTTLEEIPPSNFHEGHKPSLINGTPENYPNLAVFAMKADPAPESDRFDQFDSWLDSLLVEIMVKGLDEDTTNRRVQRTAEAVVMCLRRNETLGGSVTGLQTAPTIVITDLYAVRSPGMGGAYPGEGSTQSGGRYLWQGASIQFRITKDSVMPTDGPETFAGSSTTDYSQYIDQG